MILDIGGILLFRRLWSLHLGSLMFESTPKCMLCGPELVALVVQVVAPKQVLVHLLLRVVPVGHGHSVFGRFDVTALVPHNHTIIRAPCVLGLWSLL